MRLPSVLKTKTIDATYTPEGHVVLTVGGKDIPALETILAAHHYDVAAAWQYLKEQIPSAGPPSPSSGKMGRPAQFAMFSIDSNYKPLAKR